MKKIKKAKNSKFIRKINDYMVLYKRQIIISLLIIVSLIFIFSVFNTYLYLNFIFGNDILIELGSNKDTITLKRGETDSVIYDYSVVSNPFCKANCHTLFIDKSRNELIEIDSFIMQPGVGQNNEYVITAKEYGSGQDIYSFEVSCNVNKTFFCHTNGQTMTQIKALFVNYGLNESEQILETTLNNTLNNYIDDLVVLDKNLARLELNYQEINDSVYSETFENSLLSLKKIRDKLIIQLNNLNAIWEKEDYNSLFILSISFNETLLLYKNNLTLLEQESVNYATNYNLALNETYNSYFLILDLLANKSFEKTRLNQTIMDLMFIEINLNNTLNNRTSFEKKIGLFYDLKTQIDQIYSKIYNMIKIDFFKKQVSLQLNHDLYCILSDACTSQNTLEPLQLAKYYNIDNVCENIDILQEIFIDNRYNGSIGNHNLSELDNEIEIMKYGLIKDYAGSLDKGNEHYELLNDIIASNYPSKELNPALNINKSILFRYFISLNLTACNDLVSYTGKDINKMFIEFQDNRSYDENDVMINNITFEGHALKCCMDNNCSRCCDESCKSDPGLYPIMIVHGHAFNKDTSAEYSLLNLNFISKCLEKIGYVNLGTLSSYDLIENDGVWSKMNAPISIKVSYYYDNLYSQDNLDFLLVQRKSETIDTYAIRLNELIDIVIEKTGRDKIDIIAHSMGGLAVRRYLQIFGDSKIDKVILITVPNSGVEGSVSSFCPLKGEKLECRDMEKGSFFLQKLNSDQKYNYKILNIIGRGCITNGQDSDGVVLVNNANLQGAENVYINGTCNGIYTLHTDILNPDQYPAVLEFIKERLKE